MIQGSDVVPQGGIIILLDSRPKTVECYIMACFDGAALAVWARYPYYVSFSVCGIAEKAGGFAAWVKFGIGGG